MTDLGYCFGCGPKNPRGLHLIKKDAGNGHVSADFTVTPEYCGFPDIMHGGIIAVMMDEVMSGAIEKTGLETVTISMELRYRSPGKAGMKVVCDGWIEKRGGQRIYTAATLRNTSDGRLLAEGWGVFSIVDMEQFLKGNKDG